MSKSIVPVNDSPDNPLIDFSSRIRRKLHNGDMHFSLVDIMVEFSDTTQARRYWSETKKRLKKDGFDMFAKIVQLKLKSSDGKQYSTDCADLETCLRIVQSIPSEKAEPIRQWLAGLGLERIEETADPSLGVERAISRAEETYRKQGKDQKWIATRLHGIDERKEFTDALSKHIADITGKHYGIATNKVYTGLWGRDAQELKNELGLKKTANLRDHQTSIALHYQGIVEEIVAHHLGEAQIVPWNSAAKIIEQVSAAIGVQAEQVSRMMGIDLATGRPLLPEGKRQ